MHDVGIIGAGYISSFHVEALRGLSHTRIVGVYDTHREKAELLAKKESIPRVFRSLDELIASKCCNFAHVLVPPPFHKKVAVPLLKAGIHVFLEKPMATSSEECRALMEAAKAGGAYLGVNYNALFHPAYLAMKKKLQDRTLGNLHYIVSFMNVPLRQLSARQFGHWMFQLPQNIILEQGVHPLSQIYDLAGKMWQVSTLASGRQELSPGKLFYDTWQISMICEKAVAQVFLSVGQEFTTSGIIAICEDGLVQVDLMNNRFFIQSKTRWPEFYDSFQNAQRLIKDMGQQSLANLGKYILSTLQILPRSDPFFLSIQNSIRAFYQGVDQDEPFIDGSFGSYVVEMCERISEGVALQESQTGEPNSILESSRPPKTPNISCDVLVIGGTGFIGYHLVKRLLAANLKIRVLARNTCLLPSLFQDPRVEVISGDMENLEEVSRAIKDVPIVVHLAQGGGGDSWEEIRKSMVYGTRNIAEACLQHGVKRLIYLGSIAALYLGDKKIITDPADLDPHIENRALYARGKAACEKLLWELHKEKDLPVCILRPGIVIGEGRSPFHSGLGQFNQDTYCIGWNDGKNPLPLVLVEDVAEAIFLAMKADTVIGKSYNVVGDVRLSAREYIGELARILDRPLQYYPRSPLKLQVIEMGKWAIKKIIGRTDATFPSYRDLKSRGLVSQFDCSAIKKDLKWTPVADRDEFIQRGLEVHKKKSPVESEIQSH
ncbi:MAG TPA: NAD-dependent epimerase/dehydratase family protein [Candidatus Limnocylindrales bacterium]|nr:NAD-dependent epimerase/dehydratase family protein [Candidatus Limnocylindrales bacterium]